MTTLLLPTKLGQTGEMANLYLEGSPERVNDVQYLIISRDTAAWVTLKGVKEGVLPLGEDQFTVAAKKGIQ
ncbi:hypothetical protein FRC07_002235 [Ceratobasidium sp. 392]|nr:hypothetical protein FRC07_002235 [Ceratobasidium sp. 392]